VISTASTGESTVGPADGVDTEPLGTIVADGPIIIVWLSGLGTGAPVSGVPARVTAVSRISACKAVAVIVPPRFADLRTSVGAGPAIAVCAISSPFWLTRLKQDMSLQTRNTASLLPNHWSAERPAG